MIIHAQQVEKTRLKRKNREFKRAKSYEGGTSKGRLEIQYKSTVNKRVFNQVSSNLPKANKDRVSNPMSGKGKSGSSPSEKPTCTKCGKKHMGE